MAALLHCRVTGLGAPFSLNKKLKEQRGVDEGGGQWVDTAGVRESVDVSIRGTTMVDMHGTMWGVWTVCCFPSAPSVCFFFILCVSKNRKCSGSIWRITSQVWSWIKLKYWSKRKVLEDWVHFFFCYCQPLASGCMDANYNFSKCVNLFLAINSRRLLV